MFKLHYHVSNGGDGSASVHLHPNEAAAEAADESQPEGWGESSASHVTLKVEDGKIFYQSFERVEGKYQYVWRPCEEVPG